MESAFGSSTTSHTQLRVLLVEDLPRRSFFVTVDGLPRSSLSFDPVQSHWDVYTGSRQKTDNRAR
jgi:hypothetical protein